MQSSLDGKISGRFFFTPEAEAAYERDNEIRNSYEADAVMNGAVTCAEIYAEGFLPERTGSAQGPADPDAAAPARQDSVVRPGAGRYVVCVDPKGTLKWSSNSVVHRGGPRAHVIEILTEDIDDAYLSYLDARGISYLFAGKAGLDLPLALQKLRGLFGIERVLLTGGGQMNLTFLAAGCVDELNLVLLPFVAGSGSRGASIADPFDGDGGTGAPFGFRPVHTEELPGGALWLRYLPL